MRSFASSLAFFCALSLHADVRKPAPPDSTIDNIRQFAEVHLNRSTNLSCTQMGSPASSGTVTIELSETTPHHGAASNVDTGALFEGVFAASNATEFQFDHWGTVAGKVLAIYRYSNHVNGKTHAGLIYADETTGAISRITFRGVAAAHLSCSANSR
jgi:hypothetical protein